MSAIEKLFPTSPQERSFQMKARRDAGHGCAQLGAAAICRVQKMRPPCHAAGLGQEPVCLPQLRGAFGNRRLLSAQHGSGPRNF